MTEVVDEAISQTASQSEQWEQFSKDLQKRETQIVKRVVLLGIPTILLIMGFVYLCVSGYLSTTLINIKDYFLSSPTKNDQVQETEDYDDEYDLGPSYPAVDEDEDEDEEKGTTEKSLKSCYREENGRKEYKNGEAFVTSDGCATCTCYDGLWDCQVHPECESTVGDCEYNGEIYHNGDQFPSYDECNTCECRDGEVICTDFKCHPLRDD